MGFYLFFFPHRCIGINFAYITLSNIGAKPVTTFTKKELQAFVDQIKSRLMSGQTSDLEQTLLTIGLPVVCSKAFIDFCRIRNEKPLVLLLASLAISNDIEPAWSQRVLDVYQSIVNEGELVPGMAALAPRHVLRQAMALIVDKKEFNLQKGILGSSPDVVMTIELLLDYDQSTAATDLLTAHWGEKPIDVHLLDLAKSLLSRQSSNGIQLHCVNQWIAIFEFVCGKLTGPNYEVLREQFALIIAENHLAAKHADQTLQWCQRVFNEKDLLKADYYRAKALCLKNDHLGSVQAMDHLLTGIADQPREWLESAFKTPGGGKYQFDLEAAQSALRDMQKVMSKIDKKIFLVSGTLLGYERVGNFLSHDKDIDVGIYGNEDQFEVIQALTESKLFHVPMRDIQLTNNFYIPSYHVKTHMAIDVFVYHRAGNKLRTGVQNTFGYLQNFDFTPFGLQAIEFVGVPTHAPDNIDLNLRENFGDWRTPDPHYISHLQSPSTVDVGGPIYLLVARLELLRYIVEEKPIKGSRVCDILRRYTDHPLGMSERLLSQIEEQYGFAPLANALTA